MDHVEKENWGEETKISCQNKIPKEAKTAMMSSRVKKENWCVHGSPQSEVLDGGSKWPQTDRFSSVGNPAPSSQIAT